MKGRFSSRRASPLRVVLGLFALTLLGLSAGSSGIERASAQPRVVGERPECVVVRVSARYGAMAYDHWVQLESRCASTLTCSVRTDVNPAPTELRLEPGARRDVATFHGSPATEFVATVDCR